MQEDIDHRAVALVINTTKMTGRALKSAITKYLAHCRQKAKAPPTGRQTVGAGRTGAGRDEHRDHRRQHPLL